MADGGLGSGYPVAMLDIPSDWVRVLDMSSFTGDAWGLEAGVAVPPAAVPRFISDGSPLRWTVSGMSTSAVDSTFDTDTVTTFGTRVVKLARSSGAVGLPRLLAATSGTNVNAEFTEADMSAGDVFVLSVVSLTAGGGSAAFLWVYPTIGVGKLVSGVSP